MISPIWSSLTIKGGVSASVSPATRSIRSLSWKALFSPAKPRLPGRSAIGARSMPAVRPTVRISTTPGSFRSDITASANFGSRFLALEQLFVAVDIEGGECRGAGDRMRRIGIAMGQFDDVLRAAHEGVMNGVAHQHAAHRRGAIGDALGEGQHVRQHAIALGREGIAEPAIAGDDLVEDQEDAV